MSTELAPAESQALVEHEAVIERGLTTFTEVGNALLAIRDERLYRSTHSTFEDYCQERWGFNRHRASQLISAAGVVTNVTSFGLPAPANEGQARELARVPEPERAEVWRETIERTGGKPTAAAIRETYAPTPEPDLSFTCNCGERFQVAVWHCPCCDSHWHPEDDTCRNCVSVGCPACVDQLPDDEPENLPSPSRTPEIRPDPAVLVAEQQALDHARLDAELDAEMEGTDVRFRRNFASAAVKAGEITTFDPDRIGDIFTGNWDRDVGDLLRTLTEWCDRVAEARRARQRTGLRLVGGAVNE